MEQKKSETPHISLRVGGGLRAKIDRRAEEAGEDRTAYMVRRALEPEQRHLHALAAEMRQTIEHQRGLLKVLEEQIAQLVGEAPQRKKAPRAKP